MQNGFTLAGLIATASLTASLAAALAPISGSAADALLAGTITSATGEKMGGVTVSAKAEGATITTTVFTDEAGNYFFPPLPAGKYRVWAQALSFEIAKGDVDLDAARHQDFTLAPTQEFFRQLPGDLAMAALPEATADDRRLKRLVINNCTGCHTASFTLQHQFDDAGWSAIIDLMKHVNVSGVYQGPEHKAQGVLDYHQKELAAYLARARGPQSAAKIKLRPRPAGETARVVFKEYDVPVDPDLGVPARDFGNNGSDWSLGTPSRRGSFVHDAVADLDGNLWFTSNVPNRRITIGRIDGKSGKVDFVKLDNNANGLAANTHGMTRDPSGTIWFNVNTGRGGLGKLEPASGKIVVYIPPTGMSPTGGATTEGQRTFSSRLTIASAPAAARLSRRPAVFPRSPASSCCYLVARNGHAESVSGMRQAAAAPVISSAASRSLRNSLASRRLRTVGEGPRDIRITSLSGSGYLRESGKQAQGACAE